MSARRLQIVTTDTADAELNDVLLFTQEQSGSAQHSNYRRLIRNTITTLAETPSIGRSRDELSRSLRSYPVGSHVIYYRQTEPMLIIARIMHSRQDPSGEGWEQTSESE